MKKNICGVAKTRLFDDNNCLCVFTVHELTCFYGSPTYAITALEYGYDFIVFWRTTEERFC